MAAYFIFIAAMVSATSMTQYDGDDYGYSSEPPELGAGSTVFMIILAVALAVLGFYMAASVLSANLDVADGKPVSFGTFFRARSFGAFLGTALLTALGVVIGFMLFVVPGIVFAFFAQYATYFAVDRGLGPVDAIKASVQMVKNNLGPTFLVYLITLLVGFVAQLGSLLCGIGLLFTMPVGLALTGLIHVYTYRRLTGGVIAPAPV